MGSDELRAGVVRAMETATTDLVTGRYGDPHVGFIVLVHPDQEPTVVALTPRTAQSMETVRFTSRATAFEHDRTKGRFFTAEDVREAKAALVAIDLAFRMAAIGSAKSIQEQIRAGWERHREYPIRAELDRAAYEAKRPAKCASCGRRFTVRGLPAHQAKNRYCAQRLAAPLLPDQETT